MSDNALNPIRLGLMPPLTGLVGLYGIEICNAARIACAEINAAGGLLGRPLELIIEDDGSLPDTAVPAALRLVEQHHCDAIIGNLLSNSRIAVAAQVAEPKRIPYLNFSFYEGSISGRYFFHFAALPNQQIDQMIPWLAEHHGHKMFFAGNNYEWPRGSIDAAKRSLAGLGGDVLGEEYLPIGASLQDIDSLLQQVALSGADVFVPYFAGEDQVHLLTRFTEMGLKKRMAVAMGHYDEMMVSQLPPQVREGFYSSNTYFMSVDTAENRNYLAQLAQQPGISGIWPNGNGIVTNFGEGTYLCVRAYAKAVQAAGTTEPEAVVDALENVRVASPQGEVVMDAATHHAAVNSYLARCNADGSFSIVESFGRIAPVIPERYRQQATLAKLHESPPSPQVSARISAEASAAMQRLNTARQILSIADMAIIATNELGLIAEANPSACSLFGYTLQEMVGMSIHLLLPPHIRERHVGMVRGFVEGEEMERRMSSRGEISGYRKDGSFFPLEAAIAKFRDGEEWMLVVTMRDVTERKRAEEDMLWRATHDGLTQLPNRALIRERLVNTLQRSQRQGLSIALLFIDLDGFKLVNDTHGHQAGDALLIKVAARLIEQVRPGDTVARLAGDEFVVLCEQLEQPTTISALAERINEAMRQPVDFNGTPLYVTASIGIAVGHGSTHTADDLLRSADAAMYEVKQKGRDGWQFFSDSLEQKVRQRLSVTEGLRHAMERQELSCRFQPIVSAENRRIVGAELLLRWHPQGGEISPAVFIPIAEMTGPIVAIGLWVFRQGCLAEVKWRQRWGAQAPSYVSVNVSTRQLDEETLAQDFAGILRETGADPSRMLIEITETSLMADVETNLHVLRQLAELGLRVAVDDFGTGYSSLAQLTRMPVSVLKIDKAFVDGVDKQADSRTLIRAIIGLGRSLGMKLVAEGVENEAQMLELRSNGCHFIQGYLCHRPLDEQAFIETVDREISSEMQGAEPSLYFLLYVSQAAVEMDEATLAEILGVSKRNNQVAGITGCMLYQDGCFMQILEGSRDNVLKLMEYIQTDTRHKHVRIVMQGNEQQRVFLDWSMEFHDMSRIAGAPDFSQWRRRTINFLELAEDARMCYSYITAFKGNIL
ncbi:MAG: ABC transporter substrate-binding protein [Gammaproteobacteria bacterium]|nr:ABC transporter substrate-binding protein [Sideroxydans sp.]MBU3903624.1 ABC transporter substrate-binding protein [Gammaproteobacteria bacterium]MBU4045930.1 ABC transporter substrate-binding protein [Gammaproteobacteria bacterium]MBU4151186.1 ABC transporter substrate-binding protein [Gammaproteobacteria bacterium]